MLSIKSLVAGKLQLPTLIFDEIDTGISGEAARQVGMIMKGMSGNHQIIAITHQPQIAARASSHFFVYKKEEGGRIKTSIRKLDVEERIMAIARMLSGENQHQPLWKMPGNWWKPDRISDQASCTTSSISWSFFLPFGLVMLHGIIRKKFDPRSSGGNLMIYILFHAAMIFLLVYLASLLIIWSTYWFIKITVLLLP